MDSDEHDCAGCQRSHAASIWLGKQIGGEPLQRYLCLKAYFRLPIKERSTWGELSVLDQLTAS